MENKDKDIQNLSEEDQKVYDEGMQKIKDEKNKMRMAVVLAVFIAMMFLVGSFITIGLVMITSKANGAEYMEVINCIQAKDYTLYSENVLKACALAQGYGNLICYTIIAVVIAVLMKDTIIEDFKKLKTMKIGFVGFLVAAGFFATSLILEALIGLVAKDTQNQASIEMIMKNGGMLPMIICTVFLAPFVEEFVYRKIIFKLAGKYSKLAAYILSVFLFALPHVISSMSSGITLENMLQLIPYAYAGVLLAVVYDKSGENVFASMTLHFFNNFYSAAAIIIVYGIQG